MDIMITDMQNKIFDKRMFYSDPTYNYKKFVR